jgi:SOS-response transcriptional repressor LexA
MRSSEIHRRTAPPVLTDAELRVYAALEDLSRELGYAPTLSQMLSRLGWSSKGSLHTYLERLRRHRVIEGRGRALRVVR